MSGRAHPERGGPRIGVVVVNFGEPASADPDVVEPFLERIFLQNAGLEPDQAALARARELARERTPTLVADYEEIGGSPLNEQADAQARALQDELRARGLDATTYSAFQFTPPFIADRLADARADGVELLVGLPVYPLCGHSTTAAALEAIRVSLDQLGWSPRFAGVSGWHHHPAYATLRAETVRGATQAHGIDLGDADTLLYFSVHGTPVRYLDEGSRYDRYVEEHCRALAELVGVDRWGVGFQNHTNRRVAWTQPDNEDLVPRLSERRLVIVPVSFMHEQSETIAELDGELRALCERQGKEYFRVPIPHDAPRFVHFLADLVAQLVDEPESRSGLTRCRCVRLPGVWCTNGDRDLPRSPYATAAGP